MRRFVFLIFVLILMLLLPYSLKAMYFEATSNSLFSDVHVSQVENIVTTNIYEDVRAMTENQTKAEECGKIW